MNALSSRAEWKALRDRTREARRSPAPLPEPVPGQCRWCRGTLKAFAGEEPWYCQAGCETEPVFTHDCADCGRPFKSGRRSVVLCAPCDRTDAALYAMKADIEPEPLSRKEQMRERLGVSGDVDE